MDNKSDQIIFTAQFHLVLIKYFLTYISLILLSTVVGIIVIPFWLAGIGAYFCKRYYESLECYITETSLIMKHGYIFRTEKTIPLDKIQDLTLKEGPLLRAFNTCILKVETAGQSNPEGKATCA